MYSHSAKLDYTGTRTKDGFIDWVSRKAGSMSISVSDCESVVARTKDGTLALNYFGTLQGDLYDAFVKAAWNQSINDRFTFYHTSDTSCIEKFGLAAGSSSGVSLTRAFDDSPVPYSGDASESAIVAFAKKHAIPQLINFSDEYIEPIFADGNPAVILMTE